MNYQRKARGVLMKQIRENGGEMAFERHGRNVRLFEMLEVLAEERRIVLVSDERGVVTYRIPKPV